MAITNRYIKVSFQREGIHKFPGADTNPDYATGDWRDVSFLGYPHRHIFHFYVTLGVSHNDRDVEFIILKSPPDTNYWLGDFNLNGYKYVVFHNSPSH